MKKQLAVSILFAASAALTASGAGSVAPAYGDVRPTGRIGGCLDRMVRNHVFATDAVYLADFMKEKSERHNIWQTEFWGKYMHAAVPFWTYTGSKDLKAKIDASIDSILAHQEPGGYIGNYPDDLRCGKGWDVWGMKYTLLGLLHYWDGTKDARALEAAKKLCDYVIGELGPDARRGRPLWKTGNFCGMPSCSILEPVVWLYKRTNEKRYLDFATFLVKGMSEVEDGPRLVDLAIKGVHVADRDGYGNTARNANGYAVGGTRNKAYEMISCYQGLLEYYEVTGREDLLKAGEATAADILAEEENVAGGMAASEMWFHGKRKQHLPFCHLQETCVTTTWMRYLEKLLALTGNPKYADALERTFYNAYLASMNLEGTRFAAYTPLAFGIRNDGHDHCNTHQNCCNSNGPRGFLAFLNSLLRAEDDRALLNFYVSGTSKIKLPKTGDEVSLECYAIYPRTGSARVLNRTSGTKTFTLSLRIPAWSRKTEVKVNGTPVKDVKPGAYLDLRRAWTCGDAVEIAFDMQVQAHNLDHAVAFTRGPIALARDSRFRDGPLCEPWHNATWGSAGKAQKVEPPALRSVRSPSSDIWMAFEAELPIGSHSENQEHRQPVSVHFCDYASAGNLWSTENDYRVWIPLEWGAGE